MIQYNMRNRGAYEYDKFVLNVLQLFNDITLMDINEFIKNNENYISLTEENKSVNELYDKINLMESEINSILKSRKQV